MYRFLATPGVEVTRLPFASDGVVWLSLKVSGRNTCQNRVTPESSLLLTSTQRLGCLCMAISNGCERMRFIATQIRVFSFSRGTSGCRSQPGPSCGHAVRFKKSKHISEFVTVGPKHYAYRIIDNESEEPIYKVRCITLNYHSSQVLILR